MESSSSSLLLWVASSTLFRNERCCCKAWCHSAGVIYPTDVSWSGIGAKIPPVPISSCTSLTFKSGNKAVGDLVDVDHLKSLGLVMVNIGRCARFVNLVQSCQNVLRIDCQLLLLLWLLQLSAFDAAVVTVMGVIVSLFGVVLSIVSGVSGGSWLFQP